MLHVVTYNLNWFSEIIHLLSNEAHQTHKHKQLSNLPYDPSFANHIRPRIAQLQQYKRSNLKTSHVAIKTFVQ